MVLGAPGSLPNGLEVHGSGGIGLRELIPSSGDAIEDALSHLVSW